MTTGTSSQPEPHPRDYDYSQPTRRCDIVMKGGITSGVVYPHAVCELARTYKFERIGGTSAGAIAAAGAAAAELGRAGGGFRKLAELPDWIGGGDHLVSLFQPQRRTRPLFRTLVAAIEGGRLRLVLAALRNFPVAALLGLAPGVALIVFAILDAGGALLAVAIACGLLLALLGAALAVVLALVLRLTRAVPDNYFGLCSGFAPARAGRPAPLTTWLADLLDDLAREDGDGDASPLTFGRLWAGPGGKAGSADRRWLGLEMMTTNLTNRRAERLPLETREFFFDPRQFRDLFPERIVKWLLEHSPPDPEQPAAAREWRLRCALMLPLRPLPAAADLPVIVATRMSLSFPVLLSAVPLWTIDMSRTANQDATGAWRRWASANPDTWEELIADPAKRAELERAHGKPHAETCWFSDGGISSNFPIHFFDAPLPRWPTFGINLRPFHPDHPRSENESENVWMPQTNAGGILEWWYRFARRPRRPLRDGRLSSFGNAVVRTMQNRVDEVQMRVPGYRDRVVHIGHTPDEGGLNLTMSEQTLHRLTERGRWAAVRLVDRFARPPADPSALSWDNHRWVRFRSTMAALEGLVSAIEAGYRATPEHPDERTYGDLVRRGPNQPPDSYRWRRASQLQYAREATQHVVDLGELPRRTRESLAEGAPSPAPVARVGPRT